MKIVELLPGRRVVWQVLDNEFNFIKNQREWKNTTVHFDISTKGNKTEIRFTHEGLVPAYECSDICSNAWGHLDQLQPEEFDFKGERPAKCKGRESGISLIRLSIWGHSNRLFHEQ